MTTSKTKQKVEVYMNGVHSRTIYITTGKILEHFNKGRDVRIEDNEIRIYRKGNMSASTSEESVTYEKQDPIINEDLGLLYLLDLYLRRSAESNIRLARFIEVTKNNTDDIRELKKQNENK